MTSIYFKDLTNPEKNFIQKQINRQHAIKMLNGEIFWYNNYYNDFNKFRSNTQIIKINEESNVQIIKINEENLIEDNLFINLIKNLYGFFINRFNELS